MRLLDCVKTVPAEEGGSRLGRGPQRLAPEFAGKAAVKVLFAGVEQNHEVVDIPVDEPVDTQVQVRVFPRRLITLHGRMNRKIVSGQSDEFRKRPSGGSS